MVSPGIVWGGTALVAAAAALAEWRHSRRVRRVAHLAFGPAGRARAWTRAVPLLRVAALAALTWGLLTLLGLDPVAVRPREVPEGGWRHLVIALDVSPSMRLEDAGPARNLPRARRASEVVLSLLGRIALDQVRVSVVAFYTGAKPVVVDCQDLAVVRNILDELPLESAFEHGRTRLIEGVREAFQLGRGWKPGSATLLVVSDGDTVPDTGLPPRPAAFAEVLVLGVGDARGGRFIDGHQSRQDAAALRQLAGRLRGVYHDGNDRHLPSARLAGLARAMPLREEAGSGRRRAAMAAAVGGGLVTAALPLALALAGTGWQRRRGSPQGTPGAGGRRWGWEFPRPWVKG